MKDIMVDLETMGVSYRAAIVAIGACRFDLQTGAIGSKFYTAIDLNTCMALGMTNDANTVLWWLTQSDEARAELTKPGMAGITQALDDFAEFCGKGSNIWGNGSNFDNRLLREAYELAQRPCPWHYRADRDMRTVVAMAKSMGIKATLDFVGTKHHALHDAVNQAKIVGFIHSCLRKRVG